MKYCSKCGKELKQGIEFCTSCGAPVKSRKNDLPQDQPSDPQEKTSKIEQGTDITFVDTTEVQEEPVGKTEPDKPQQRYREGRKIPLANFFKSKKFIISAVVILLVVIAGLISFKVLDAKNDPAKIVQQFEEAVKNENAKEVANLLNSGQDEMKVSEKDGKSLLACFKENPDVLADTIQYLKDDAAALDQGINSSETMHGGLFSLVDAGKKWLFFSEYGISFKPIYIEVTTNQDETEVLINNEEQGKLKENDKKTFGPFLPIEQQVTGIYNGPYGTVKEDEIASPFDTDGRKIPVSLDLASHSVYLDSNYGEAIVFVNGESTEKTVNQLSTFGPVAADGSIKIHAELEAEGKTAKSQEYTIEETGITIYLHVDDRPIQEEIARKQEEKEQLEQDKLDVERVVYTHYQSISYGHYSEAYELFSSSRKKKVNFDNWAKGLENNISNTVTDIKVESVDGNKAIASFELVARDYTDDDKILVQTFSGKWHLVKENSFWKLSEPDIKKTGERIE